jgi:signal transduction histidine kinase
MLYDEPRNELYFEVALGAAGDAVKEIRLKADEGIAGSCAQSRETIVVEDVGTDTRHAKNVDVKTQWQTRNMIATPLVRGERLIGVLEVLNKRGGADFTDEDVKIIRFFADQAAIALENAFLVQRAVQAERLAATGQAVLSLSHYIKNILTGMKGSGSLIDMGLKQDNLELVKTAWPIVLRSQLKITSLVQDMLRFSKGREPDYAEIGIAAMLEDIRHTVAETAQKSNVAVIVDVAGAPDVAELDETGIHDAVLNLVVNAIDACKDLPEAKVAMVARAGARSAADASNVKARSVAAMFTIQVIDNGTGIPENIRAKIFEAFFSTKGSKGTGLGLAVVKKTVEEHGGELVLESNEGTGTTFTMTLPVRRPAQHGSDAALAG